MLRPSCSWLVIPHEADSSFRNAVCNHSSSAIKSHDTLKSYSSDVELSGALHRIKPMRSWFCVWINCF